MFFTAAPARLMLLWFKDVTIGKCVAFVSCVIVFTSCVCQRLLLHNTFLQFRFVRFAFVHELWRTFDIVIFFRRDRCTQNCRV